MKVILNIAYADLLERARRYSFLIIIGITVFAGISSIPDENAIFGIMCFDEYRGIYNTAWVSYGIALTTSIILSLFGFFLVKNTIDRDTRTGVGHIIASTPVSNLQYCSGKMLSNVSLLSVISFIMMLMALIMQLVRKEESFVNLWDLLMPFLLLTLPTIIFISALAVYFETVAFLKDGLGNIVFLFIWLFLITAIASGQSIFDLTGGGIVVSQIKNDILSNYTDYNGGYTLIGSINIRKTFYWYGVKWSFLTISSRAFWILISLVIIYQASISFKRFAVNTSTNITMSINNIDNLKKDESPYEKIFVQELTAPSCEKFHITQLIIYESYTLLKGLNFFWYVTLFILNLSSFVLSIEIAKGVITPVIFLAVSIICSKAASKEIRYRMEQLVYYTPNFDRYQIFAVFTVIILLFAVSNIGIITRYIILGMWVNIVSIIMASFLITSILLLLGVLSRDSKLFEVFFMIVWYIGPLQKAYPIDFINLSGVYNFIQYFIVLLTISLLFLLMTFFIRKGDKNK